MSQKELGKNVTTNVDGDTLTITVNLSKSFGRSKSGKSTIIATSEGNQKLNDDTYIGLNIYKK